MLAVTEYRAMLGRFFVLVRMEKLATAKLHMATDMGGGEQLLTSLHEELRLMHLEKLKLVSDLQEFVLARESSALFMTPVQQPHNSHGSNVFVPSANNACSAGFRERNSLSS